MKATLAASLSVAASALITAQILSATGGRFDGRAMIISILCPLVIAWPASAFQFWQNERLRRARDEATSMNTRLDQMHRSLVAAHAALAERARHDPMTGILNRETFLAELRAARRPGRPAALLIIDIDHFKAVNDTHGHLTGDRAIRTVSSAIQRALRGGDLFGRIGGEEFAVYLVGAEPAEAEAVSERIRLAVEQAEIRADGDASLKLTVSIGGACDVPEAELRSLLGAADRSLYEAKNRGRNQARFTQRPEGRAA